MQPLQPTAMQLKSTSSHEDYRIILPDGVPIDNLKDQFFWKHVAKRLVCFDTIQVIPEDGSWIAEFYVVQVGEGWARVAMKSKTDLESIPDEDAALPKDYSLKWGGPVIGWQVLHKADRLYPTANDKKPAAKLDALNWLKSNSKNLAA